MTWLKMEMCPIGARVLFWWKPPVENPDEERPVIGRLSEHRPGYWWDPQAERYLPAENLAFWQCLPGRPSE